MVVDAATGKFVSARTQPKLVLVEPAITESHLSISAPGMETIKVLLAQLDCKPSVEAKYEASEISAVLYVIYPANFIFAILKPGRSHPTMIIH